jgi:hypothetical protein
MMDTLFFVAVGIAMLVAIAWLLRRPAASRPLAARDGAINPEGLAVLHLRFFPQLRQTLSESDDIYLRERASAGVLRGWRESRRRVMREFLAGLYEDFAQLNHMARAVSRLAPRLDSFREAELFWLGLRFRLIYRLAQLELTLGYRPAKAYLRLTGMLGGLGNALEQAAATLAEESAIEGPPALSS